MTESHLERGTSLPFTAAAVPPSGTPRHSRSRRSVMLSSGRLTASLFILTVIIFIECLHRDVPVGNAACVGYRLTKLVVIRRKNKKNFNKDVPRTATGLKLRYKKEGMCGRGLWNKRVSKDSIVHDGALVPVVCYCGSVCCVLLSVEGRRRGKSFGPNC